MEHFPEVAKLFTKKVWQLFSFKEEQQRAEKEARERERQERIKARKNKRGMERYRKAGYSKKFLAEHEAEILLHKAAKKAFDDMGIKKLPTVKSLQDEYASLLSAKKKLYPEYASTRQEMRDLQMAKANVFRLASLRMFAYNKNCEIISERRNCMEGIRGYISIREASCRWGVSERRVNQYCAEGRIPGASRFGKSWAIPEDAKKPSDPRKADTNKMSRG